MSLTPYFDSFEFDLTKKKKKRAIKKIFTHVETRITCERSESARERRIVLYKSNQ